MPLVNYTLPDKIIDLDDRYANITAAASTNDQVVLSFYAKPGKIARIVAFRNTVDAAGIANTTWHLLVNLARIEFYGNNVNQWGSPEQDVFIPVPKDIPMGAQITVTVDNSLGSTFGVYARVIVAYFDPPGFGAL